MGRTPKNHFVGQILLVVGLDRKCNQGAGGRGKHELCATAFVSLLFIKLLLKGHGGQGVVWIRYWKGGDDANKLGADTLKPSTVVPMQPLSCYPTVHTNRINTNKEIRRLHLHPQAHSKMTTTKLF